MAELKPCPFCGITLSCVYEGRIFKHLGDYCPMKGYVVDPESEKDVEKWNRRASE